MRARFGNPWWSTAGVALPFALVVFIVVRHNVLSSRPDRLVVGWIALAPLLLVAVLIVARLVRAGTTVTSYGVLSRRAWTTVIHSWATSTPVIIRKTELVVRHGEATTMSAVRVGRPKDGVSLTDAVAARDDAVGPDDVAVYGDDARWRVVVLAFSLLCLVIGTLALEGGVHDADRWSARAARDVRATASVLDQHITKKRDDGSDTYRTFVRVLFTVRGRSVSTVIDRPGEHTFAIEQRIPIVYDRAHPLDADFGDRSARRANDLTVTLSLAWGTALTAIGAIGCVAMALLIRRAWRPAIRAWRAAVDDRANSEY